MKIFAFVSIILFVEAVAAALLQPLVSNPTSPIRAPIFPPALAPNVLLAFILFIAIILAAFVLVAALADGRVRHAAVPRRLYALALLFSPLYFLTFTLTKESTAAVELLFKSLGL